MKNPLIASHLVLLLCYTAMVIIWQVVSSSDTILLTIFPPPMELIRSLVLHQTLLYQSICITLFEAASGLLLAAILALIIAILFDKIPFLKRLLMPLFIAWQAAPLLSIAPLITLWLGFGYTTKVTMVILICFFPILLASIQGLEQIDRDYINLLKSYGATSYQLFYLLKLPLALPSFFAGLKVSASYALGAAITAEWVGAQSGLGVVLLHSRKSYDYSLMLTTVIIIIALSLFIFHFIRGVEKSILKKFHLQGV